MRRLGLAVLSLWLAVAAATAARAMFGPLSGTLSTGAPVCSPPTRLAGLPRHFMMGVQNQGFHNPRLDAMLWAHDAHIPVALGYIYANSGWDTSYGGNFVSDMMSEAYSYGETPVFTWYIAGSGGYRYFNDAKHFPYYYDQFQLLMQRIEQRAESRPAGAALAIVDVEPDTFGFLQNQCQCTNAAAVSAVVGSSGYSGVPGFSTLPDTVAGLLKGLAMIRNAYAPNAILAYHVMPWAGGHGGTADRFNAVLNPAAGRQAGQDVGGFYNSAFADSRLSWDAFVVDVSDADSGFNDAACGGQKNIRLWWGPENNGNQGGVRGVNNFQAWANFVDGFRTATGLKGWAWQVPVGNTVMRAQDNDVDRPWPSGITFGGPAPVYGGHFQDDRVQYWLQNGNPNLQSLIAAGLLGIMWGGGQDPNLAICQGGRTKYSDTYETDMMGQNGPYNPPPIGISNSNAIGTYPGNTTNNGVERDGINDNDGGFLRQQLRQFYKNGPPSACP